ncbi:hypothetical protein ACFP81_07385 [Deinococcus lacus]|uniref:Cupin n=1 Tax=Deinococcus lacus TaxID=392561 RepID=A0ABW1YEJ1_9DEIO
MTAAPQALHLPRLAAAQPGHWVGVPGSALAVITLRHALAPQAQAGWLTCLSGEVVIDLPGGDWVRLQAGEAYSVPAGWRATAGAAQPTLLLAREDPA